uniref:S-phase kinase-associated protein 2 n=2 Tax=Cacopsylla melanoneura TaxID=428564 RepID=A0A8D8TDB8_9HEMI
MDDSRLYPVNPNTKLDNWAFVHKTKIKRGSLRDKEMVGKENTTLTERRSSQDSNRSISMRNSQDSGIHLKSSQESNTSFNHQQLTDEETHDLGISILPEKQKKENELMDDLDDMKISPRNKSNRYHSDSNENIDIDQIENSPPRKSLKRSSSLELEKFTLNRKKKSALILNSAPNYFDSLSDEVMLLIFTYLNKKTLVECSQVSKRWKRIAYDDELWMRIDVSSRTLNTTAISSLLERNPKYLRMSQTHFRQVVSTPRLLRTEYLDLSMAKINVEDLGTFLSHFNNLKKLSLEHITCDLTVCQGIAQNVKLNCLNLSMCKNICEHFLELLLTNCKGLLSLNLSWCNLNAKCLEILCNHLSPNLIHLNLAGCLKNVENHHVEVIARRCVSLIELDLSDCTQLSDEVISVIVNHFPKLSTLSLSRCYNIAPNKYGVIISSKPSIKYFNVYGLLHEKQIDLLQKSCVHVSINKNKFSVIARPTVGDKRTSIWGYRVRDSSS